MSEGAIWAASFSTYRYANMGSGMASASESSPAYWGPAELPTTSLMPFRSVGMRGACMEHGRLWRLTRQTMSEGWLPLADTGPYVRASPQRTSIWGFWQAMQYVWALRAAGTLAPWGWRMYQ